MTESIVGKRLIRNLRYKLTYIKIFESYLEQRPGLEVAELLKSLIEAQQTAVAPLASYLRGLDINVQETELNDKLLAHAAGRDDLKSRLRFIYDGLYRATAWYGTQLLDRQMTTDPQLRSLLLELGEIEAAKLWRTEAVMGMLKIPAKLEDKAWDEPSQPEPKEMEEWRPRLVEDLGRPAWGGKQSGRYPKPPAPKRKEPSGQRG